MVKESFVTVEPTSEPITKEVMKVYLKVDGDDDDTLIESLITSSRQYVENYTGRSLMSQTRVMKLDYFPCAEIELMNGPVTSVTSVKYQDSDDAEQTVNASDYWTDLQTRWPRIRVKNSWPSAKCRPGSIVITYVCGYATIPEPLLTAIKRIVAHKYENREENSAVQVYEAPLDAKDLMSDYILVQDAFY